MKKILVSLAVLLGVIATPSQAADGATGVGEAGIYMWRLQSEFAGKDLEEDYAVGFFGVINTPTPMTPNVKMRYNAFSEANDKLKVIDLIAFGSVLDNGVVSVKAGVGASNYDGKLTTGGTSDTYGGWVADLYLAGDIIVPTTNMTLYLEMVQGTDSDFDTTTSDIQFGAKFALVTQPANINLFAGYRIIDNDYDDFGLGTGGKYEQKGFLFGVSAAF